MALVISDKADFRTRKFIRDKKRYYIIVKGSILQKDIIILIVYAPTNRTSKCIKQNYMEKHTNMLL